MSLDGNQIYCPDKVDFKKKVYGDRFTPDELHFLRCRDAKFGFMIDTRINDAFRNGFVFNNPKQEKEGQKYIKQIRMACKFAVEDGWSGVLHLDGATPELKSMIPPTSISLGIQCLNVYLSGLGGLTIKNDDLDPKTGMPVRFWYKRAVGNAVEIEIDAKRVSICTWGDENPFWQGYTGVGRLVDPAIGMRTWLGTALRRQRDYPTTRYIIPLPASCFGTDGNLLTAVKTSLDAALSDIPYTAICANPGDKFEPTPIGGPIETDEESLVVNQANSDSSVAGAVAKTDMEGGEAGNATSVDANQAIYFMTSKDIQQELFPFVSEVYERLGMPIEAFKPASEMPAKERDDEFVKLTDLYGRAPPSIQVIVGEIIQDFVSREFGKTVVVDVEGDNTAAEERMDKLLSDKSEGVKTNGSKFGKGKAKD